jgi:hypothetical protein
MRPAIAGIAEIRRLWCPGNIGDADETRLAVREPSSV